MKFLRYFPLILTTAALLSLGSCKQDLGQDPPFDYPDEGSSGVQLPRSALPFGLRRRSVPRRNARGRDEDLHRRVADVRRRQVGQSLPERRRPGAHPDARRRFDDSAQIVGQLLDFHVDQVRRYEQECSGSLLHRQQDDRGGRRRLLPQQRQHDHSVGVLLQGIHAGDRCERQARCVVRMPATTPRYRIWPASGRMSA